MTARFLLVQCRWPCGQGEVRPYSSRRKILPAASACPWTVCPRRKLAIKRPAVRQVRFGRNDGNRVFSVPSSDPFYRPNGRDTVADYHILALNLLLLICQGSLGQAATQAGTSRSGHRSHLMTLVLRGIDFYSAARAGHDARPAAHTFFRLMAHHPCFIILDHGPCDAGLHARGFVTVLAINAER